ncbi:type VI secretion system Vgr family protein [Celeribacter naphthalenivorans]|uniref:type VI secretion system Vgr family protein n=1 Tax=Celeribacter naphthalenivorans TaxID=1614694 RepID=UPI001CF9ADEE|nr:type VI secretion system tip protein TssI/VgrG [Celeribacter naphthalenivorans]
MSFFSQTSRMGRLTTALGEDVLVLMRFEGEERINGVFSYHVDCLASADDIDFDALLGTHATVTLRTHDGSDKPFDGIISEARWMGAGENGHRYRLTLKPWFWLASLRRNQRIFHNKTVIDILTELLGAYASAGKMETRLTLEYPELEYTVQYRESDMDFAARLMERHGISYHFEQDSGSHLMVLTDIVESHATIGERPFKPYDGHHQEEIEHFWEWRPARRITTGAVRLTDYNFKTPTAAMETNSSSSSSYAQGQIESFEWPGDYLDQGRGDVVARLRSEGETGQDRRFEAQGDIPALGAGLRVTLGGEPLPGTGEDYLCLVAYHSYTSDNYGSGGEEGDGYAYTGRYVLLPADAPLVPELKTAQADVKGPQTAVVVGDGEIDCDEYGRILVQFHWDLDAAYSMRCRVSQSWAGNGWGGMVIPRIGMEVVVEFLDGDPDKPLVTGCVYNGKKMPPAALPLHSSRSTFKTNSVDGEGFNELTFEDKAGEEFVYLHAQKNLDMHIENSSQRRVEFDDAVSVGNDSMLSVAANRTVSVEGDMGLTVIGALSEKIDGNHGHKVGADFSLQTGGDLTLKAGGEIVIDASKITLVAGGSAVVVQGGAVNVAPVLNVGNASPGAAAIPAIPAVLKAAAGEGSPFVSHCPLKDEA